MRHCPPGPILSPYPTLFRSSELMARPLFDEDLLLVVPADHLLAAKDVVAMADTDGLELLLPAPGTAFREEIDEAVRSEEHTSELQSLAYLVCRLLLEKKNYT